MNNFMACMLAAFFLENLSLGSFRAAAVLLAGLLLYDAFWVFGSSAAIEALLGAGSALAPEKGSVMMDVASSPLVDAPTKLLFPAPPSAARPEGGFSLLGLGDIVVPGLLLAFTMRFDESGEPGRGGARRDLYFAWALGAYALGLGLTFLANTATSSPQPALRTEWSVCAHAGTCRSTVSPTPSWPWELEPQAHSVCSASTATA